MSTVTENLIRLGFNENEAKVYHALLKIGKTTTGKISKETGLHTQLIYNALETLVNKGYVNEVKIRGRKYFSVTSPEKIYNTIKEKEHIAEETINQIQKEFIVKEDTTFEIHEGEDDFKETHLKLLNEMSDKSTIKIIGGEGERFFESMGGLKGYYEVRREEKKIDLQYIGNESQRERLKEITAKTKNAQSKILSGKNHGKVSTVIYETKVVINIYAKPLYIFIIENPVVAESYQDFFDNIWKLAKEI